jgi:hypothetical protein
MMEPLDRIGAKLRRREFPRSTPIASGASRALLEESDPSHAELVDLLQHELLGTSL